VNDKFTVHVLTFETVNRHPVVHPLHVKRVLLRLALALATVPLALACTSPVSAERDSDCEVLESHATAIQWYVELSAGNYAVRFTGLQGHLMAPPSPTSQKLTFPDLPSNAMRMCRSHLTPTSSLQGVGP
jgi:hypothetical protein